MKSELTNPEKLSVNGNEAHVRSQGIDLHAEQQRKMKEEKKRKQEVKEQQFEKFTAVSRFWSCFNQLLEGLPMWKCAATRYSMKTNAYFSEQNYFCLATDVGVANFMAFKFSVGKLAMPVAMTARREGRRVTLTWSNDFTLGGCRPDDELMLGYFYDSYPGAPQLIRHTGVAREDERLEIEIPVADDPQGETLHLYPFFCSKDMTRFSQNYYFKV